MDIVIRGRASDGKDFHRIEVKMDDVISKLGKVFTITAMASLIGALIVLDCLALYAIGWGIIHYS